MLTDFVLVHVCMLFALALPVVYLAASTGPAAAAPRLREAMVYYTNSFVWLSFLFPLAFLMNGFYTRSRAYIGRYKKIVILRGAVLSSLVFLAANFLLLRRTLIPRSALVVFCVMVSVILLAVRLLKAALLNRFEIRPKNGGGVSTENGTVLVLGGAGYIGSTLVRKLLEAGRKVRVVDSLVYGDDAIRDVLDHPNLELQIGDCRKIQDMVAAVKGVDSVIHLAAIVGDPACEQNRRTALEINYAATRMLIEVAKGNGIRRFIFASSCSVYGATDLMMDENSIVQPLSLYGQTKVDSEQVLLMARTHQFHPVILRLATVFGLSYRPRFDLVVNLLTAKAFNEGTITIFNGEQWRPFIHVHDVADGIIRTLNAPLPVVSGEVFNMGDTRMNFTLSQVADRISAMFPGVRVEHIENSDRRNYRVSFDKIRNMLRFEHTLSLEYGIQQIRRAFEEKEILDYTDPRYYNQKFLQLSGSPCCKDELDVHVMAAFAQAPAVASNGGQGTTVLTSQAVAAGR